MTSLDLVLYPSPWCQPNVHSFPSLILQRLLSLVDTQDTRTDRESTAEEGL